MGFTHISEDSSEIAFLLVENYNHDRSCLASAGQGIFVPQNSKEKRIFLFFFIASGPLWTGVKKKKKKKKKRTRAKAAGDGTG